VRQISLPVCASCAVMMQESLVASGWHWRPVMTLPFAMMGPELALARTPALSTCVSQARLPVRASTA